MEIYIDLRCFQDPGYAFRGVGYHSSTLLREGRKYFEEDAHWIGIIDSKTRGIPREYTDIVDEVTSTAVPRKVDGKKLFIQLSPMTHAAEGIQSFLRQPEILAASLIYDFIPLDLPERYLTDLKVKTEYASNLSWLRQYDLLFPISQYSASRLTDLVDIDCRDIYVTGVALRAEFQSILLGERPIDFSATELPYEYFLFVGGADRRKNVNVVLESHARLNSVKKPRLIIVGAYQQKFYDEMIDSYKSHGGNPRDLEMRNSISDNELAALYRNCLCSICSSEIEGFSLPVIEAMSCGACVFVSDIAAHRELVSLRDALFEPHDSSRLIELMERASKDKEWTRSLANAQEPTAHRFLLERVAYRFWNPVVQRLKVCGEAKVGIKNSQKRMRLAILSPFPPDRSGVADYTRRSLEEIGKLADVDVFCETANPIPTKGVQRFLPLSLATHLFNEYDQVVSVVGNSHFHARIIEHQIKFGGPCLIHDNRLAELYNWWKGPEGFHQMACRSLGRNVSYQECQDWLRHPGRLPSLFFDDLIPRARPLMVHSKGIQAQVRKQYGVDAVYLPFCVYRNFPDAMLTRQSKQIARQKLGIEDGVVAIITLGFVDPTKSPHTCIEAVAQVRQAGINAHLYFVGSCAGKEAYIVDRAKQLKIRDAVHLCGDWVEEQVYNDFVAAADLAIQLRTHFFGGLSGAMLDCIASGLVTVANVDLAEAMDAPASVLRISDRLEVDELAQKLIKTIASVDLNNRLTEERSSYVSDHSFPVYARSFIDSL